MKSAQPEAASSAKFRLLGLSFLAPAALVLLPALALAFASGNKNENYEWTQHRVTAIAFAAAFVSALLFGNWRRGWPVILASLLAIGAMLVALPGMPGIHWLFVLAGVMVAIGYRFAVRQDPPAPLETVAVGLSSIPCFWAASRLLSWQAFDLTFASWVNRFLFLGVSALLVRLLYCLSNPEEKPALGGPTGIVRLLDALMLAVLAAAVLRTNSLPGDPEFPHHWGVYTVPADLVREGYVLLGEVPSQYGMLSTLLLAALPTDDRFTALFWLNAGLIWTSGAIIYFALKTWLTSWWWQLSTALITIGGVAFLCGNASTLSGPMLFPSVGAMRFIWVHALLGFLLWHHLNRARGDVFQPSGRAFLWIGSGLWLMGALWSVESAVYVTAAWFPAASLFSMQPPARGGGRLRRLLAGMMRMSGVATLLLGGTILFIAVLYGFVLGCWPEWNAYWEYATAFSAGFGALAIESQGAVWTLLLLHAALLASIVSLDLDRQRSSVALIWAAWGTLWTVSTYYISRSHANNITNLSPVLLLIVALLVHALRSADRRCLARPWLWLTVPPYLGAVLWLVLTQPAVLKHQLTHYAVEPHTSRLLKPTPPALKELIAQCVRLQPGPYAVVAYSTIDTIKVDHPAGEPTWLPLTSLPLFYPLPAETRFAYADVYTHNGQLPGWLIAPIKRDAYSLQWVFDYVESRYAPGLTLANQAWQAWYLIPRTHLQPRRNPAAANIPNNIIKGGGARP